MADILTDDRTSVIVTEDNDKLWSPVISTLVQVMLNPDRRTIRGFEALLSKEFIFLTGIGNRYPDGMATPNHVVFGLLIDCMYQLLSHNIRQFEFTSLYLIRLFDLNYLPSPFATTNLTENGSRSYEDLTAIHKSPDTRSRPKSYHVKTSTTSKSYVNHELPLTLANLDLSQLTMLCNPVHELMHSDANVISKLSVPTTAIQIRFFEGLYLRWLRLKPVTSYYHKFPAEQSYYFNYVLNREPKSSTLKRQSQATPSREVTETEL